MKKLLLLLLTFFVTSFCKLVCQPYYFTHYQVENGLSNNAVMCSLQDHNGFMWFGTRDGLNRFDGLSFKVFRTDPENPNSIGSNAINCIYEDDHNQIWVGTEKGIYRYDEITEKFTQLKLAGEFSIRNLRVIKDEVWFIELYTLYAYNIKTDKLKNYQLNAEMTDYWLMDDGTLWTSTGAGTLNKFKPGSTNSSEYNLFTRSPHSVSKWIESLMYAGNGIFLVGTSNEGLKLFDSKTSSYKDIFTLNPDKTGIIVREIIAVDSNEYWVATQSGIYILNTKTGSYNQLTRDQNDPWSLSDNIVHTLCKDNEGGIWAGTYFGGINYYSKPYVTFKKYFPKSGSNAISGYAVREICNDNDANIWIGTEDAGLNKLDPATGDFTNFNNTSSGQSISYSNIHGLLFHDNTIWAGTYLHGLDVLDIHTGKRIKHYNTSNSSIGSNFIYSLFKTKKDSVLVLTDKGLYQYLPQTDNFKLITLVKRVFFRAVNEEADGTIWAGTYGDGVFYYNPLTGKHGQFLYKAGDATSISSNLINRIFVDSKGIVWFATEAGLCKYDKQNNRFERYTTANGLPSNVTYAILEDKSNNLWVSTSKGLVLFSPSSKIIRVYTRANGLITDQFNYSSGYKDGKGQMYFGSVKGLITFFPDSIKNNNFLPPVFLTGFQVYNKELPIDEKNSPLKSSITFTKEITLPYSQSSFSIDFAALSYTAPNTTHYNYKMEGLEKDWTHLETNRKAYFTELKPGTYYFKVAALSGADKIEGKPAMLTIKILPPLWKTWWAYLIYAICFLSLCYLVVRYFINRSRERNRRRLERMEFEKERENYNDKIEFFINVAHEIRTPLTLIRGPMENIMDRIDEVPVIKGSLEIMNKNTDRLLHLTNQLLDFRKVEMNGFRLNLTETNISTILNDHLISFKEAAREKNLKLQINYPDQFNAWVDEDAFSKIISNLWDNAVKYAENKMEVILKNDTLSETYAIIFKNDGFILPQEMKEVIFKSFQRAKETSRLPGTGIGLTLSRSLAELHGGKLDIDFSDSSMNTFILTMPVKPKQVE